MAKVKVFLSFEFDRDADLYRNFFAQADRGDSCHDLEDYSLNEAYRPHDDSWKKKARKQIDLSDIVCELSQLSASRTTSDLKLGGEVSSFSFRHRRLLSSRSVLYHNLV